MERNTPVRKSHTSTADLLVWTETPPADHRAPHSEGPGSRPGVRSHQPSGGISAVLSGEQLTEEEAESAMKRKPCSDYKMREITGSGIFSTENEEDASESGANGKTGLRLYQQAASTISQISFSADGDVSPKKPVSIAEVAKQRELSGSLESESDLRLKKQTSDAKCKELSGHDIFGPPPEIPTRPLTARHAELKEKDFMEPIPRNLHTSVKVSNPAGGPSNILIGEESTPKTSKKICDQKIAQLSGNDIFKSDTAPSSAEKSLSAAKLKEMSGNDIFADGKASSRDYFGGVRKPPGGESSIALV